MKLSTAATLLGVLALSAPGLGACAPSPADKAAGKESGMMTALRAVFAFKACTDKLEDKFGLKDINGVSSDDMEPIATGRPGEWDVKFTADVTEKQSGRVSRYTGVCHVRRDQPTTLDATFVRVIKPGAVEEVRRSALSSANP